MLDLPAVLAAADPYAALDAVRQETPVARSELGIHLLDFAGSVALLRDARFHQGVPQMLDHAAITDPAVRRQWLTSLLGAPRTDHDRMRRLMTPSFTPRAIRSLGAYVAELTDAAADAGEDGGTVDLVADVAQGIPPAVFCRMIGAPEADAPLIGRLSSQILAVFARRPELAPSIETGTHELVAYVHRFVEERRRAPREGDLISNLLLAEEDGERLTPDEMVTLVIEVLEASTDNTASQLALVLHAAALDPDRWAALRADPELIPAFVEEASRRRPRIMCIGRVADEDVTVTSSSGDVAVPAGTVAWACVPSAHRDPAANPGVNLNYGSGGHFCLGASLARMEMVGAIEVLARRWRTIEPAAEPVLDVSVGVVTVESLPLAVTPA